VRPQEPAKDEVVAQQHGDPLVHEPLAHHLPRVQKELPANGNQESGDGGKEVRLKGDPTKKDDKHFCLEKHLR